MPVVRTCAPFEEGILHLWNGMVGCPPIGLGLKVGSEKLREVGSRGGGGLQRCEPKVFRSKAELRNRARGTCSTSAVENGGLQFLDLCHQPND